MTDEVAPEEVHSAPDPDLPTALRPGRGMFMDPELTRHWRYYLLLEAEFETALRYVEPHENNFKTFSLEFGRQLLASCAQFENVARLYCAKRLPEAKRPENIQEIRALLVQARPPNLQQWRTRFYPMNATVLPFSRWSEDAAPPWWKAYTSIKHGATKHVQTATLEHALMALVATGMLTMVYLKNDAQPGESRLFDLSMY